MGAVFGQVVHTDGAVLVEIAVALISAAVPVGITLWKILDQDAVVVYVEDAVTVQIRA